MAFENHIIASMNNPNAVIAWREASFQHHWKIYHADRGAFLDGLVENLYADVRRRQGIQEQVQKELLASREENRAVHMELGEMHEVQQSALTLASTYSEAYFEQRVLTAVAEKNAFRNAMFLFAFVALQAIGGWGELLLRLS